VQSLQRQWRIVTCHIPFGVWGAMVVSGTSAVEVCGGAPGGAGAVRTRHLDAPAGEPKAVRDSLPSRQYRDWSAQGSDRRLAGQKRWRATVVRSGHDSSSGSM
jgi:hypothetical protein